MKPKPLYRGFVTVERAPNGHEVVRTTNAVAVLVHDVDGKRVIMVEQHRPAMVSAPNPTGELVEVPAGRRDDGLFYEPLIVKELKEEIGVTARQRDIQLINPSHLLATSPGVLTERLLLAYVPVRKHQIRKGELFGNAAEGEHTRRIFVDVADLPEAIFYDLKTFALVQWFLRMLKKQKGT